MSRQRFDIGSKWLLQNQGMGALQVGGLKDVLRVESLPGEIVQNRKIPDGLLRTFIRGDDKPHLVLVEVATYAENRALKQALNDLALSYSAFGHLPDLLMLVLRPKGRLRIGAKFEVQSDLGLSRLSAVWKVVELWTLPAEAYLVKGDVGVVPWVPLMHFDGEPEAMLERCAEKIKSEARQADQTDLLMVTQVVGGLKFPRAMLASIFGGEHAMIESPVLQHWKAETGHAILLDIVKDRFGAVPRDVTKRIRKIIDEKKLRKLSVLAGKCRDIEAFRDALPP